MTLSRRSIAERFWPKVDRRGPDECWLWTGARTGTAGSADRYGYLGAIPASSNGPAVPAKRAHVASWEIRHGQPVPSGMTVCHTCDVPLCVNPDHLFAGTQGDNNRDRAAKGREANRHGSRNPNSKLTPEQVAEIRQRYSEGESQGVLAREFGVIQPHVSRIVRGESWTGEPGRTVALPVIEPAVRINHSRRLSDDQVSEIRRRYASGERQVPLASEFGVSQACVSLIVRGGRRQ